MDATLAIPFRFWILLVSLAYTGGTFLIAMKTPGWSYEWLDPAGAYLAVAGAFVPVLFRPLAGKETLWQVIYCAFGFFYITFLFSFTTRIIFGPWDNGIIYALFFIAATKFTDSGAYAIGSLVGRHKMIPHISPGKTWEGLFGAFLGAFVAGMSVKWATGDRMSLLSNWEAFWVCMAIAVICVVGDLAESIVKRCLGVKDSGKTLPGIGGALDLTDSLLYTGPFLYFYLRYAA